MRFVCNDNSWLTINWFSIPTSHNMENLKQKKRLFYYYYYYYYTADPLFIDMHIFLFRPN